MEDNILKYRNALKIQENYSEFKGLGKLNFNCSCCDSEININGSNSHSKLCSNIHHDKMIFIKYKFNGYDKCVCCDKKIDYSPNINRLSRYLISFCSTECKTESISYLKSIKKCTVCGELTVKSKTCSKECGYKLVSDSIKTWHNDNKNTDEYLDRNKRIGEKSKINFKGRVPWNRNLKGDEYLKHFIKNGRNTLYDALIGNKKWFIKTNLEIEFEKLLVKLDINYKYSFFINRRQFDFYIDLGDTKILVEVDGDYWHKSSRRCDDVFEREKKRKEDFDKFESIQSIKSKYKWYCIRFWEYNIYNDEDDVINFLSEIKTKINLDDKTKSIYEYYKKNE